MSGKPAARVTDPTACPLPGHGNNPIVQGSPDVIFDGLPAAREGDVSACGSSITSAVSSTVFINGKPAATLGSVGAHGNVIIGGSGTVIIGDMFVPAPVSPVAALVSSNALYSGRFQLIDQETGKPVVGRRVKVWSSDGWSSLETTDAEGMTSWVKRAASESIHIDLVQGGEA
ncbi:Rhs element Vgr protein [Pseudomonas daroniae]|uniref:Rhs element Vgr protein n=1 Tax=Phytopseudomonas daroniae TaxID=2487519 RepID=A0A4Q9QS53_9GAMM|nr:MULTISPECIES: PAAR domain-containing protein [Pseudomonas]TBU76894.1 Rhs element Vgr protein [Pseudomonas sp. FRB 228]TBU84039.1 Rhs element Vgr protein [Pseudomonas daroniae]TBU93217.1 Rhs element Vgr protein [Pseudomonas daroniae]